MGPARFPTLSTSSLPADPREMVAVLRESLANGSVSDGYVRAGTANAEHFLFLHQGKAHSAGVLEEDRFSMRAFGEFFGAAVGARSVAFCHTDPAILLCTAVLFRKAPSAQIPARLLNSEELLYAIRETGKDAVLVVRNGDARTLVFCKGGEPAALYAADGEQFPDAPTVADRIVGYLKVTSGCQLDLYDEIKLKPSAGAGQPLESYVAVVAATPKAKEGPAPSLIVRLGDRVAFRFPVTADESVIGRGEGADLPLDNVSVSRRHAVVKRRGSTLLVEDLGSDNGIVVKGQKVKSVELNPGDEFSIGKYTLIYPRYASQAEGIATAMPRTTNPGLRGEETMMMNNSKTPPAVFEHRGQKHKMGGLIFNIGKADDAHLRITGLFVAGIHARVLRDPAGGHSIQHVGGLRKVLVNGKAVKSALLKDGDEVSIAGEVLRVSIAAPAAAGSARLGPK